MYQKLFTPIKIRSMELKNRIVLPAMGTKFSGKTSYVTDQLIDYHVARVKGGTGLSIVEVCSVHSPSAPRGFLSISEDCYIPGMKRLTDAIHENGGKAGLQLWQGSICVGMDPTAQILVASDMPMRPGLTLPGITKEQIAEVVECYGKAAARAKEAGFDCVELHMAHNYLPHSFLSGGINHRTDEYGGSLENRSRFPLEVIRAVRANIPEDMPVFMRIDAHDDYLENGLTIEEVIEFCKRAKEAGIDVLDVSRGNVISAGNKFEVPPIDLPRGFNIDNAARIRKETGMLTIGVGRINTAAFAEEILEADKVDMVVMGRAQLADPDFVTKSKEGRLDEINYCVGCDQGCLDGFANTDCPHITCLRNPAVGREKECEILPAEKPETVLIAGGGIAGLEAAIVLKQRGHLPILCEATDRLGGQFLTAGEAPRKEEMKQAVSRWRIRQKTGCGNSPEYTGDAGADQGNPPAYGDQCDRCGPDHSEYSGSRSSVRIEFSRCSGRNTDRIRQRGRDRRRYGRYGSGRDLAEKGCKVTDLEMLKEFCADMGSARKTCVTESVYAMGITPVTEVTVTEIKDGMVIGTKDGETVTYPCDYAVMAVGSRSRDGSALEAASLEIGCGYFTVGDAGLARRALDAVREAFDVAITFDKPEVHKDAVKPKKIVFVTGATGKMGQETMKQLLARSSRFKVRILARASAKNKALLKKYMCPALEIVWGDMADYDTILKCVTGASYVLHIGAMVSPMADDYPEDTLKTNIGSTLNIIKAIKAQPDPDAVHFAYVATVAMTGQRLEPIQFGRVGDPINPSIFDYYGLSKVFSEWSVFDSGLKHWVSIRQTGQHPSAKEAGDLPIVTHQPPNNVLEWSTAIESGICMANLCEDWVPESFWRKAYNLSSGKDYRLTTWELMDINLGAFGMGLKDVQDSRMMAKYNFHGHYYTDSDLLDDILHFRCIPADQYWAGVREEMRRMAANPLIRAGFPTAEQMFAHNKEVGSKRMGTYWMFENNEENWIKAFFGSREQQKEIKAFDDGYDLHHPSEEEDVS